MILLKLNSRLQKYKLKESAIVATFYMLAYFVASSQNPATQTIILPMNQLGLDSNRPLPGGHLLSR